MNVLNETDWPILIRCSELKKAEDHWNNLLMHVPARQWATSIEYQKRVFVVGLAMHMHRTVMNLPYTHSSYEDSKKEEEFFKQAMEMVDALEATA